MDISEISELISTHPLFARLTQEERISLSALFTQKNYQPGEYIAKQDEVIDSIFCIAKGQAEVRHSVTKEDTKKEIPLSTLKPGEFVGLNTTNFYSSTGARTASVIAITQVTALRLDLAAFHNFVSNSTQFQDDIKKHTDLLYRMYLIKHAVPFAKIKAEQVRYLAEQVKSLSIKAGEILFHIDDKGDDCFLIQKGKIQIFIPNQDDGEETIAILTSPAVFGEVALLMSRTRTASARALADTELLVISRELLSLTLKKEKSVTHSLMKLLKLRSKPKRIEGVDIFSEKTEDNETVITLKDPINGNYYQLSEEGLFIWNLLDGKHTIRNITIAYRQEFEVHDPDMVANFILDLEQSGFLQTKISRWSEQFQNISWWTKIVLTLRNILEYSITFGEVDKFITKTYHRYIRFFYTHTAQIIFFLIMLSGLIVFLINFNQHVALFSVTPHSKWLLYLAFILSMSTTILHELAHAYTAKFCGRHVFNFGIGWYWLGPVAFCDTSDMWLATRKQRILVDAAGLYCDIVIAGLASLLTLFINDPIIVLLLWTVALYNYLAVFCNLSPIVELDGYYLLMDLTGKEDLRESAILWVANVFRKKRKKAESLTTYKFEILYIIFTLTYLVLSFVIPYIIMNFLLSGIFGLTNPYLSLIIPTIILIISSLTIWEEIKQTRK